MASSESRAPTLRGPPAIERADKIALAQSNLAAVLQSTLLRPDDSDRARGVPESVPAH